MTTKSMPCISLWQPWASLVMGGFKQFETRSWKPPASLVDGLIAVHASKRWTRDEQYYTDKFIRDYPEVAPVLRPEGYQNPPLGAILCVCRLVEYRSTNDPEAPHTVTVRERSFGDWSPNRYVWRMEIIKVPPEPIPMAGKQGIWRWEYEL